MKKKKKKKLQSLCVVIFSYKRLIMFKMSLYFHKKAAPSKNIWSDHTEKSNTRVFFCFLYTFYDTLAFTLNNNTVLRIQNYE